MGWVDTGCYGSTFYETPNIDRLAGQGVRFINAYAACPVCSPTRASILTGKYPARLRLTDWIPGHKMPKAKLKGPEFHQELPLDEVTIAEALKDAGYRSASIGKWHLGKAPFDPEHQGFNVNFAGGYNGHPESYFYPYKVPPVPNGRAGEYLTDRLTDEALRFIEENRDRPFFLYLPHYAVHTPLQAKEAMIAKYRDKAKPGQGQNNPTYAAMIQSVDEGVGRVMDKLEALAIAERTIVFFMSDNGGLVPVTSNAPLRAGKGTLYEGGIREPMIVRWPGVTEPGAVCDTPVISVDFFPTILDMAGVKPRVKDVDGLSLVPLLKHRKPVHRHRLYWHYPHYHPGGAHPSGAVRDGDYKLIESYENGHVELYNLKTDISEADNLAEKMPEKARDLRESLHRWLETVDAQMPMPNPDYDPTAPEP
jgi:arylsulfatase A-like enzyme